MPIRISERKLLLGIVLFAISLYTLFAVKLIATPVYVSEKGVLLTVAAVALLIAGVRVYKSAVREV